MKIVIKKLLQYLTSLHVHLSLFDQSIACEYVYTMSEVKCRGCVKSNLKLILISGEKVDSNYFITGIFFSIYKNLIYHNAIVQYFG